MRIIWVVILNNCDHWRYSMWLYFIILHQTPLTERELIKFVIQPWSKYVFFFFSKLFVLSLHFCSNSKRAKSKINGSIYPHFHTYTHVKVLSTFYSLTLLWINEKGNSKWWMWSDGNESLYWSLIKEARDREKCSLTA